MYVSHEIFSALSWKPIAPYAQFPSYGPDMMNNFLLMNVEYTLYTQLKHQLPISSSSESVVT